MDQKRGKPGNNKILKLLPKATSGGVYFHNPPYSPSETAAKIKANCRKGFSGPLMIQDQARRKSRSDGTQDDEPTSPKVSCMGQIKHRKKQQIKNKKRVSNDILVHKDQDHQPKHGFAFRRMFSSVNPVARKSDPNIRDVVEHRKELTTTALPDRAPSLSQMKRFESGRGNAFANLGSFNVGDYEDEDEDDVRITFSAPLRVGGEGLDHHQVVPLQPRKEINIWKRRTMAPPRTLELKPMVRAH